MSILNTIVQHKKEEVAAKKATTPEAKLTESSHFNRPCISLSRFLTDASPVGIIAEFKRKSPSLSVLRSETSCRDICVEYEKNGASALSILTDSPFFGGTTDDLFVAREAVKIPLLRKEFIIDPYQILEAKSAGADAILLIAAILRREEAASLATFAVECGLEVLLEVHCEEEIAHWQENMHCMGVNNRDLRRFTTNTALSHGLFPSLPAESVKVSESGLHDADTIAGLYRRGYRGFLIGEYFLRHPSPGLALHACVEKIKTVL